MHQIQNVAIVRQKRSYALDALRGFAILAMILSGTISYQLLPAWMGCTMLKKPHQITFLIPMCPDLNPLKRAIKKDPSTFNTVRIRQID